MKTESRCALCGDKVRRFADVGDWFHPSPASTSLNPHDPLVECPRCGADLDGGRLLMAGDLPGPPWHLYGWAFSKCLHCGGVWHRWGKDTIRDVTYCWGPDNPMRATVEAFFVAHGGSPNGEGVILDDQAGSRTSGS
jgi:DNA-directed RNA polymerase subunit RPC12/RpoP